jgi:hypothetical protein
MAEVKYKFAELENVVVDVENLSREDENKTKKNYRCLGCGEPIVPILGSVRRKHFRHESNTCSKETYLHKSAKLLLYEAYRNCVNSKTPFYIIDAAIRCNHYANEYLTTCAPVDQQNFDLTNIFSKVELETKEGDFRPDILLSGLNGEKLFLEIVVTHQSSPEKKESGYPIIEINIESEEDIATYCSSPLRESEKVKFINLRRTLTADLCQGACPNIKPNSSSPLPYPPPPVTQPPKNPPVVAEDQPQTRAPNPPVNTDVWERILNAIEPKTTQAILRQHGKLMSLEDTVAYISISSEALLKLVQTKLRQVEAAFAKVCARLVKVYLVPLGGGMLAPNSKPSPSQKDKEFTEGKKNLQNHEAIQKSDILKKKPTAPGIERLTKSLSPIQLTNYLQNIYQYIYRSTYGNDAYDHDSESIKSDRLNIIRSAVSELERKNMKKIVKGDEFDKLELDSLVHLLNSTN